MCWEIFLWVETGGPATSTSHHLRAFCSLKNQRVWGEKGVVKVDHIPDQLCGKSAGARCCQLGSWPPCCGIPLIGLLADNRQERWRCCPEAGGEENPLLLVCRGLMLPTASSEMQGSKLKPILKKLLERTPSCPLPAHSKGLSMEDCNLNNRARLSFALSAREHLQG